LLQDTGKSLDEPAAEVEQLFTPATRALLKGLHAAGMRAFIGISPKCGRVLKQHLGCAKRAGGRHQATRYKHLIDFYPEVSMQQLLDLFAAKIVYQLFIKHKEKHCGCHSGALPNSLCSAVTDLSR
jgi:hypothetical protein